MIYGASPAYSHALSSSHQTRLPGTAVVLLRVLLEGLADLAVVMVVGCSVIWGHRRLEVLNASPVQIEL